MNLAILAVVCAVGAAMLMWKRSAWKRTQAVLMFIAGLGLAGGIAGQIRSWLEGAGSQASSDVTSQVFGASVAYGFALAVVIWFALDMDVDGLYRRVAKKDKSAVNKHKTSGATPWLGLLTPVALASLPWIGGAVGSLRQLLSGG